VIGRLKKLCPGVPFGIALCVRSMFLAFKQSNAVDGLSIGIPAFVLGLTLIGDVIEAIWQGTASVKPLQPETHAGGKG
jgi:hypothetical protein